MYRQGGRGGGWRIFLVGGSPGFEGGKEGGSVVANNEGGKEGGGGVIKNITKP